MELLKNKTGRSLRHARHWKSERSSGLRRFTSGKGEREKVRKPQSNDSLARRLSSCLISRYDTQYVSIESQGSFFHYLETHLVLKTVEFGFSRLQGFLNAREASLSLCAFFLNRVSNSRGKKLWGILLRGTSIIKFDRAPLHQKRFVSVDSSEENKDPYRTL